MPTIQEASHCKYEQLRVRVQYVGDDVPTRTVIFYVARWKATKAHWMAATDARGDTPCVWQWWVVCHGNGCARQNTVFALTCQ